MNIFSSYIPGKYITFDYKDPSWPREKIKKKRLNKTVYINDIFLVLNIVVIIIDCKVYLVNFLTKRKEKYHKHLSIELNNLQTSAKTYRPILKTFYNGNKILLFSPLLIKNKLTSNFKERNISIITLHLNVLLLSIMVYYPHLYVFSRNATLTRNRGGLKCKNPIKKIKRLKTCKENCAKLNNYL